MKFMIIIIAIFVAAIFLLYGWISIDNYVSKKERLRRRAIKLIKETLKKGESVDKIATGLISNHERDPLLHLAIYYKEFELFKQLMEHKPDVTVRDENGRTPLIFAALFNHHDMVKMLLEAGSNPNDKDDSEQTALHWVGQNGGKESAELLLAYGADMYALDSKGRTPIEQHSYGRNPDIITSVLLKNGFDPKRCNCSFFDLLEKSIYNNDVDAVSEILKQDITLSVEEFNTCLSDSCENAELIKRIAPYGKKLFGPSTKINYPLFETIVRTHDEDAATLLIELGADIPETVKKMNDRINGKIKVPRSGSPKQMTEKIMGPFQKYTARMKRKDAREKFFSALPTRLFIAVQCLFILIPTIYLCFASSWLYILFPGLFAGFIYLIIPARPATGDIQGMEIVMIVIGLDVFLIVLMPILAIWKYKTL